LADSGGEAATISQEHTGVCRKLEAPMDSSTGPARGSADCPAGPFETDIDKIAQAPRLDTPAVHSQQATNLVVPIEIDRIREGGISFFQGGLMNEGTTTWYAFDLERRLLIAVLGSTGEQPEHIPNPEKLGANQLLRYTDATGRRRAEFVTIVEATPAQARAFACLANKLLASEVEEMPRPQPAGAITKTFSLLHNGIPLDLGTGSQRWNIEGELARLISQPLQEPILRTY
jgi:hypothetical protein